MKNISKLLFGICLTSALCTNTSCIEETFPTSGATKDQLGASAKATEALLWAMPAFMNNFNTLGQTSAVHYDWGYGSVMHIRDVMTGDMPIVYSGSGYDWYDSWETNKYQGEDYIYPQFIWNYYYQLIQTANNIIAAVNPETANELQLGYLGAGYAFRAMAYLDVAQMFEFLPNDKTDAVNVDGNNVLNLTAPIVRETTTEEEARNNPRATREQMAEFIKGDLELAEELIGNLKEASKALPHKDVVYGLQARLHMWLGEYAAAKDCARKAINASSVRPMNENDCLSTTKGFNTLSAWMWGSQLMAEDASVKTGIINWTSWCSNETTYGYAGVEPRLMIDARMYERISDTDFRKKMWKAPKGTRLEGQTAFIDEEFAADFEDYVSAKFRPNEGNMEVSTVGSAAAYPLMRVEEMYFIEAEAAAHLNAADGKALVTDFMKAYRDPKYLCDASSSEDVVEEIVFQKRVELWGEGLAFFDVKRLNMSVTRGYEGTNFHDMARLNTNGRPAWMNFCIVKSEANNNKALVGMNNPNPTDAYTPWVSETEKN